MARGTATSRIIMSGSDYDEDVEDMENESASEEEQSLEDQLIEAAAAGRLIEVDRLLAEGVVNVDGTSNLRDDRSRALHLSCTFGRPLVTNSLIRAGADVNATNEGGDTPLILASLNGHGSIVDALLKAGANVHATDQFGSCALFYASRQGHCGLVDALLKAGADVNGSRVTALLIASRFGHASAVVKLMHAGADVTAVDDDGNTALHRCALETTPAAVYGGKTGQVVSALVAACADIEALNAQRLTPLELAHNGLANGTSEWQKLRCRETVEVLEVAKDMTLALRRWLFAAGLAEQWREFARLGAKEKEDIEMIERDDVRRDKGSALTPIEVNRLFRAIAHGTEHPGEPLAMGDKFESFLHAHRLDDYVAHFRVLGVAFERDLLDITDAQLTLMVERHGLKILDRRRFDKAMVALRRKLAGHHPPGEESGAGEEERHPIRVKKEHAGPQVAGISV